jgi:hypothetical protein
MRRPGSGVQVLRTVPGAAGVVARGQSLALEPSLREPPRPGGNLYITAIHNRQVEQTVGLLEVPLRTRTPARAPGGVSAGGGIDRALPVCCSRFPIVGGTRGCSASAARSGTLPPPTPAPRPDRSEATGRARARAPQAELAQPRGARTAGVGQMSASDGCAIRTSMRSPSRTLVASALSAHGARPERARAPRAEIRRAARRLRWHTERPSQRPTARRERPDGPQPGMPTSAPDPRPQERSATVRRRRSARASLTRRPPVLAGGAAAPTESGVPGLREPPQPRSGPGHAFEDTARRVRRRRPPPPPRADPRS